MGVVASLSRSDKAFCNSMIQVMIGDANDTFRIFRLLRSVTQAEMYILIVSSLPLRVTEAYKHS